MAEDTSTLLASQAAELSQAIYSALEKRRLKPSDLDGYRAAHDVAARLHLINTYLGSLPPYWIEFDVEQLCRTILRDLQAITRPTKGSTSFTTRVDLSRILSLFGQNDLTDPETCLVTFFKVRTEYARSFKDICDDLLGRLTKDEDDAEGLPDSVLQVFDTSDTSARFSDGMFSALQLITECDPTLHEATDTAPAGELRHPARLCLHELKNEHDLALNIGVLVSTMDMAFWQEFCLRIDPADDNQQLLSRGGFCSILEKEITARLFLSFQHDHGLFLLEKSRVLNQMLQAGLGECLKSVLRNFDLTPKDKVMLAYAVARSYWQYYDSELMRVKWTSDTIWFMPEKDSRGHEGQLPLRAYLSFPFDVPSNTTPDILYEDLLNHRCPRIFDIGVLLLQIGLGKPFRTGSRRNMVAQANLNHKIATDELLELEKANWDGFANSKKHFDRAVKFCLNGENFIPRQGQPKTTRQGLVLPARPVTASDWRAGVLTRRRIFHKNVVRPLAWLAKRGFKAQTGDITYVKKKPGPSLQRELSNTPWQPEREALFHSAIIPKMWLGDLRKISEQVERKRRECRVTTPVRVAILDTGLNRDFPTFKTRTGLVDCITEEADFVKPDAPTMTDTFGHGTFMTRLIMDCAPGVQILVARVAENTNELKNRQENIKEAILWAGQTGKADIISMSFGLPSDDQGIREAIETVQRKRKEDIIFLASAGNSSADDESFPARHPSVISVYATDCDGTFLKSNSVSTSNGASVLGTYGDDIPNSIREEFSTTYPVVCKPGSSVATAIMAGISATMLAYAPVLPSLVPLQGVAASTSNQVLQRLWTTKGMEAVLSRLAQIDPDHPRLRAVKLMWFWKTRPNDTMRYYAICDTLSDIERKFPRLTGTG